MSFSFTIPAVSLRNVRPFTSTEESRPILNGILIESTGALCATNGHVMLAVAPGADGTTSAPARDVIIRLSKAVPKWAEFAEFADVPDAPAANYADVPLVVRVSNGKGKVDYIPAVEVAGPFPNWRAAMPRHVSATAPLPPVDPGLLDRFAIEGCNTIRFYAENMSRAVRVAFSDRPGYVGVLMPKSGELAAETVPDMPSFTESPQAPAIPQAA